MDKNRRPRLITLGLAFCMAISLVFLPDPDPGLLLEGLLLILVLACLVYKDLNEFRLPNPLTLSLIGIALLRAIPGGWDQVAPALIGGLAGYGVIAGLRAWTIWRRGVEGIGLGDAKLVAAMGAWFGWSVLPAALATSASMAIIVTLILQSVNLNAQETLKTSASKHNESAQKVAFGPFLCVTFWGMWCAKAVQITDIYVLWR